MKKAMWIAGFTGTRHGCTEAQGRSLRGMLALLSPAEGHHGDCVGADSEFHEFASPVVGRMVIHPPSESALRAGLAGVVLPVKPYLSRNRDIVDAADYLIACPETEKPELRSGTWSTVRYAQSKGKPIAIVQPNGVRVMVGLWGFTTVPIQREAL